MRAPRETAGLSLFSVSRGVGFPFVTSRGCSETAVTALRAKSGFDGTEVVGARRQAIPDYQLEP
jgi:hypothetical protein